MTKLIGSAFNGKSMEEFGSHKLAVKYYLKGRQIRGTYSKTVCWTGQVAWYTLDGDDDYDNGGGGDYDKFIYVYAMNLFTFIVVWSCNQLKHMIL